MRKILVMALAAVATLATSCKKDENNSIEGTWQIESISVNGNAVTLDECNRKSTVVFTGGTYQDSSYYTHSSGECKSETSTGKYSVSGDKITLMDNNGNSTEANTTIVVSGNTFTLTVKDSDGISVATYKRK